MSKHLPHFTKRTITEVSAIMKISNESWIQDWPIEIFDGNRVEEFLECCENEHRPEHSSAMAEVLLASLDDAFSKAQPDKEILERAARILARNPELLEYWRCLNATSDEEIFYVTPWVRGLVFERLK